MKNQLKILIFAIFIFVFGAISQASDETKVINCYGVDSSGVYIQVLDVGNPEGSKILGYVRSSADPKSTGLKMERTVKLIRASSPDVNGDPVFIGDYTSAEASGQYEMTIHIPVGKSSGTGKLIDSGSGGRNPSYRFEYVLSCSEN